MRRLHPDTFVGWTIVVLVAMLAASQLLTLGILNTARSETEEVLEHFHLAERIADIVRLAEATTPDRRRDMLAGVANDTLSVSWDRAPLERASGEPDWHAALFDEVIGAALWQSPLRSRRVSLQPATGLLFADSTGAVKRRVDRSTSAGRLIDSAFTRHQKGRILRVSIALVDGSWLNFQVPVADTPAARGTGVLLAVAASSLLVLALSIWAVRRLTLPLIVMARAAERLGQDVNAPPLPERGSREMRLAARAFNTMQERIRRLLLDRMQLIAAISHDLRTPITRLRLRAELARNEETRSKMIRDLAEMEEMIATTLSFAREEAVRGPRIAADLVSLVEDVCDGLADTVIRVADGVPQRLLFACDPLAMRRCIGNLVSNAVKFGGSATVTLSLVEGSIAIMVDDQGAGVPDGERERLFEPFARLDSSRNRSTGGVGLGLTIARTVARAHGGDILLLNRPEGGLRAVLKLPAAPEHRKPAGDS